MTPINEHLKQIEVAAREIENHCPCGARPESPRTHPHVGGCPVDRLIRSLAALRAHIAEQDREIVQLKALVYTPIGTTYKETAEARLMYMRQYRDVLERIAAKWPQNKAAPTWAAACGEDTIDDAASTGFDIAQYQNAEEARKALGTTQQKRG